MVGAGDQVERRRAVAQVDVVMTPTSSRRSSVRYTVERCTSGCCSATRATISSAVTWWLPASGASTTARRDAVSRPPAPRTRAITSSTVGALPFTYLNI